MMNSVHRPLSVLMLLLTAISVSNAAWAESGYAVVRTVKGLATAQISGAETVAVVKGLKLPPGSIITTQNGANVDLYLGYNGPVIWISEGTELGLLVMNHEVKGDGTEIETQLDLRKGRIRGNSGKLNAASKYEIRTPKGVASVRGGDYDIRASGQVQVIDQRVLIPDHAVSTKGGFSGFRPRQ